MLIDTAGIRRKSAVAATGSRAEGLSVNRALRAVRRADVVALVVDAMQGITEQVGPTWWAVTVEPSLAEELRQH